jgi:alpha-mannosidase
MEWITRGPVKATLRVAHRYGQSVIAQEFTLFSGQRRVDVAVSVDWHEHFKALKLRFPIALKEPHARFGIPFGSIERALTGEEEPAQGWVSISGSTGAENLVYGVSLVNDSKFSYDASPIPAGADLGMMVLRSPVYAQHDPQRPQAGQEYTFMDQGLHEFRYSLLPHAGDWAAAGIPRQAEAFGQPPVIIPLSPHRGERLPIQAQNIMATPESIVVSAVKLAEDGNGLILRVYEAHGEHTRAQIDLPVLRRSISVGFGPSEIKTFRIPWNSGDAITETNLIETA